MAQSLRSYAIFADDIRQEVNGKTLFVGVYRDYMYFQGPPPWHLPRFFIHVVFREEIPPLSMVAFEVRALTATETKLIWRGDNPPWHGPGTEAIGPTLPFEHATPFAQFVFSVPLAFSFDAPTRVNVVAIVNGVEFLIDRLRVFPAYPPPPPFPR